MKKSHKVLILVPALLLAVLLLAAGVVAVLYFTARVAPPRSCTSPDAVCCVGGCSLVRDADTLRYGPAMLTTGPDSLLLLYVEGDACQRGEAYGALLRPQLRYQEEVFVRKLHEFVPDTSYMRFLRVLLRVGMRGITGYIPEEYCREIYHISRHCSGDFNWAGSPYERQVNYHAAHDIGHALQDYMLVGCTSFGCWGSASADSALLIGRNFDFYISDDFARNRLLMVCRPDSGHTFMSLSWPGMIGVISGINDCGLTVTVNASKSSIPTHVATPISILAREILQYAADAGEALAIARRFDTFVSESLLIGSAADGRAVIIEKTPDATELYAPDSDRVLCTNHYQSEALAHSESNLENIRTSDSAHRLRRLQSLIAGASPLTPASAAAVLRNPYESSDTTQLKLCNDCAINQFIAHHAVIFRPDSLCMWVSSAPWQLGRFVCYQLQPLRLRPDLTIPADPILQSPLYDDILFYRSAAQRISRAIWNGTPLPESLLDSFQRSNPGHHVTYSLLGDYHLSRDSVGLAVRCWQQALRCRPLKVADRDDLQRRISKYQKKAK